MALVGLMVLVVVAGVCALRAANGRHREMRVASVVFVAAVVGTFALSVEQWTPNVGAAPSGATGASLAQVLALVKASAAITRVPANLDPPVSQAVEDDGPGNYANLGYPPSQCVQGTGADSVPACVFGNPRGSTTAVLYGDSHAGMWFQAINDVAKRDGLKLIVLFKDGCPAVLFPVHSITQQAVPFPQCVDWHKSVVARINRIHPNLLIVSQLIAKDPHNVAYSPAQWGAATRKILRTLHAGREVVIGNTPVSKGPECLSRLSVARCRRAPGYALGPYSAEEKRAARAVGAQYVDPTKWFCTSRCSPIIGHFDVYFDHFHVAVGYSKYLEDVLAQALGI